MVKQAFEQLKIAIAGSFGDNWSKDRIKRFIHNNGGEVVDYKDPGLTHVICTIKAYEERMFAVKEAGERKNVKLVSFDWFEDSLQSRSKKREKAYDIPTQAKSKRKEKKEKKRIRDAAIDKQLTRHANIVSDAKARYNVHDYSIYFDLTGFMYDITLLCGDVMKGRMEKVVLRLYAADEPPYYHATFATYFSPDGYEAREVLAPLASSFSVAFEAFKKHFRFRTKLDWSHRVQAGEPMLLKDGSIDPQAFRYRFPAFGPTGMDTPPGRYDPANEVDEEEANLLGQFGSIQASPGEVVIPSAGAGGSKGRDEMVPGHYATAKEPYNDKSSDEEFHSAEEGEQPGAMRLNVSAPVKKEVKKSATKSRKPSRAPKLSQNFDDDSLSRPSEVRSGYVPPIGYEPYTDGGKWDENLALPSIPSFGNGQAGVSPLETDNTDGQMDDNLTGIVTWNWGGR